MFLKNILPISDLIVKSILVSMISFCNLVLFPGILFLINYIYKVLLRFVSNYKLFIQKMNYFVLLRLSDDDVWLLFVTNVNKDGCHLFTGRENILINQKI